MICANCGKENSNESKYCRYCGAELSKLTSESRKWEISFIDLLKFFLHEKGIKIYFEEQPRNIADQECSYCGSDNIQLIQKSTTDVKTKRYSMGNGCCGLCLLGPFGLLCGLIGTGSKVKVSSETWMHCMSCGREFISKATALESMEKFMNDLMGNAFILGAIYSFFYYWGFESKIIAFIILIILSVGFPLLLMMVNYNILSEKLGCSIIDILSTEKRKKYWNRFFGTMGIIVLSAFVVVVDFLK